MSRTYFLFLLMLMSIGCVKQEEVAPIPTNTFRTPLDGLPEVGSINLDNFQIGQRNYYIAFKITKKSMTDAPELVYEKDTMVHVITGKKNDTWIFKEFLTSGSIRNLKFDSPDTTVVTHFIGLTADSIHFTLPVGITVPHSPIGNNLVIPLLLTTDAKENPGCLPLLGHDTKVWTTFTTHHAQLGKTYDRLNSYFDYTAMAGDGFGFMYGYDGSNGLVRMTWVSAWDIWKAEGWDLLSQ